jgi:hypothetical protein
VRGLVLEEIEQAERMVFSEADSSAAVAADGRNVVPVFTDPFWDEVETRARRVRAMAAESLAEAEDRLLGDEQVPVTTISPRPASGFGATLRNLGRTLNLQRSDAFGFVAALLAAVLLVPQLIAPVWSNAGVEPPSILRFILIGDKNKVEERASETEAEEGSIDSTESSAEDPSAAAPAEPTSSEGGADAEAGAEGISPTGEGGTQGAAAQGTPGPGQSGEPGSAASASPTPASSPAPAPIPAAPPAAPLGVKAVAASPFAIQITWTDASADEIAFQIDRRVPDGAPASVERVGKDVTSFLWTNLAPETRACFRVRSVGESVRSDWAPAAAPGYACATTPAAPAEPPAGGPPAPQPQASPSPAAPPA